MTETIKKSNKKSKKKAVIDEMEVKAEVVEEIKDDNVVVDEMEIKDKVVVELIPEVKKIIVEKPKKEEHTDEHHKLIKELREKLKNGTISNGEAAELYSLLAS